MEQIILGAYGVFLLVGGYFGFKKGSKISLIMGVVSGLLVFVGLWLMSINLKGAWSFLSCLSLLLSASFLMRLIKTKKFMPSGMLLIISLLILGFCLFHLR